MGENLIANQLPLFTDYYENRYTSERVINFDNFNLTNGVFTDALSEYYSVHVYTTAPIVKQVKIDDITLHTTPGGIADISAKLIDCAPEDQIEYSISEYTGSEKGRVQKNGIYVASPNAKSGDMVAVRASLKSDPDIFAVAIIYID